MRAALPYFLIFSFFLSASVRSVAREPSYSVAPAVYDYGEVATGANHRTVFVLTNLSDDPLLVRKVRPSCTCTKVNFSRKPVMKGQSDSIEVIFHTKDPGAFYKEIEILTNAVPEKQTLRVRGVAVKKQK